MGAIYKENLVQIGLSDKEAVVYEALLGGKENSIGQLLHKIPEIKRPNMYALLYSLKGKGLVQEVEKKGKKVFTPESPQKLVDFVDARGFEYEQARTNLDSALPSLISQFNLASGKPNVQFYEGEKGMEKVVFDSLTSKTEILSYVDHEAVEKYFASFNSRYVAERIKKNIKKKIIALDTPSIREAAKTRYNPEYTDARVISASKYAFATVMQIYDGKVSYQTLDEKQLVGVIIQDERIYKMHKALFEYTWETAENIMPPSTLPALPTPDLPAVM
ncbi:MAG: helix-turn-helix domain-containing protein [Candidatus Paceibacterota bacterium]|jgi:sugar-specific transcriptional regulator TrmB